MHQGAPWLGVRFLLLGPSKVWNPRLRAGVSCFPGRRLRIEDRVPESGSSRRQGPVLSFNAPCRKWYYRRRCLLGILLRRRESRDRKRDASRRPALKAAIMALFTSRPNRTGEPLRGKLWDLMRIKTPQMQVARFPRN